MPVKSFEEFIEVLSKSNLLSGKQLAEARSQAAGDETPKACATRMIDRGILTRWQARQLLAGKSQFYLGKYKLLDLLGEGGMGMVFKAVQPSTGRIVALKVMARAALRDRDAIARFQREIRSAAALQHPNIAGAYDADCVKNTYFLATEYIEGRDLKSWIRNSHRLPIAWSCECIRQAAVGLQYAHEVGLIHRDIKPANLLVHQPPGSDRPHIKIVDLGLARATNESAAEGELTKSGQLLGSPDYISPEQARNTKAADIRADIFSLGCTLFEMLTKQLPFPGEGVMEKLMARVTRDAPPVRSLRPDVPAALEAIVTKMLERDPQQRFQTPQEVAVCLAPFASMGQAKPAVPEAPRIDEQATVQVDAGSTMKDLMEALTYESDGQSSVGSLIIKAASQSHRNWTHAAAGALVVLLTAFAGIKLAGFGRSAPAVAVTNAETIVEAAPAEAESETAEIDSPEETETKAVYQREREAAEWVLKRGGKLTVAILGFRTKIPKDGTLPDQDFNLYAAELRGIKDVDDSGLAMLQGLKEICHLDLNGTQITDEGLKCLRDATELTRLDLEWTPVTDRGLSELRSMAKLEHLNLGRTKVRCDDLSALAGMPELKELRLFNLPLKDDSLAPIAALTRLKVLDLNDTPVTDAGMQHLVLVPNLERLNLSGVKALTDSGLAVLAGNQNLKWLKVSKTKVTAAGVATLREKLPGCKIEQ